jgi:hypothetical protein
LGLRSYLPTSFPTTVEKIPDRDHFLTALALVWVSGTEGRRLHEAARVVGVASLLIEYVGVAVLHPHSEKKEIVMNKQLLYALSLALVCAVSLTAFGQAKKVEREVTPMKPFKIFTLPCQITKGGDVQSRVKVTNNTGEVIPSGQKITVRIAGGTLPNLLNSNFANNTVRDLDGPAAHTTSCTAHYAKVAN